MARVSPSAHRVQEMGYSESKVRIACIIQAIAVRSVGPIRAVNGFDRGRGRVRIEETGLTVGQSGRLLGLDAGGGVIDLNDEANSDKTECVSMRPPHAADDGFGAAPGSARPRRPRRVSIAKGEEEE